MKDHCFDLHPCKHYHKTSHSSNRCFRNKPPTRTKIHLGWITSWQWDSTTKKIFHSYNRICSQILNSLAVEFSPSSHLISDRGGNDGHLQALNPHQASLQLVMPLQRTRDTSSSRRLQLLASFGRVIGIALSIPELLVILKPSQVETSLFRLKLSLLCGVRPPFSG